MRFTPEDRPFEPRKELSRIASSQSITDVIDLCFSGREGRGAFELGLINHADMMVRQVHQNAQRRTGGSYHHGHIKPVVDKVLQYASSVRSSYSDAKFFCLPVHILIAAIFHDYVEDHSAIESKLQSLPLITDKKEKDKLLDEITDERVRIIETIYNSFEKVFEPLGWEKYGGEDIIKQALTRVNNLTRYDEKVDFYESIYTLFGEIQPELNSHCILQKDTDRARLERAVVKLADRVVNQVDYRRAYSYSEISQLEEYIANGDEMAGISASNFAKVSFDGKDSAYSDITYQTWKSFIVLNALQAQLVPDIYSRIVEDGDLETQNLSRMVLKARADLLDSIDSTLDEMINEFKQNNDVVVYKGVLYDMDLFEREIDDSIVSYVSDGGRYEVNGFVPDCGIESAPRKLAGNWCELSTFRKDDRKEYDNDEKLSELFVYWKNMKRLNAYFRTDDCFTIEGLGSQIEPVNLHSIEHIPGVEASKVVLIPYHDSLAKKQ